MNKHALNWVATVAFGLALTLPVFVGAQTDKAEQDGFGPPPVKERQLPKMRIPHQDFNWGRVLSGEKVQNTFKVHNDGPVDLRINRVKSSCGCTTVDFPKIIKPGEFGEIVLELDTGKVRTPTIRKYATIHSNDPTKKDQKIYIGGDIIAIIAHEPKNVNLAGLAGAPLESKVIITPGTDLDIKIDKVTTKGKNVQVLGIEEIEPGKRYEVSLQAAASQRAARLRDNLNVFLTTPDGKSREATIAVQVNHKHRIQVTPRGNVVFQRKDTTALKQEGAAPIKREIILSSGAEEVSFDVKEVRIEDVPEGVFSADVEMLKQGSQYKVTVNLNEYHDAARFLRGKLVVVTDDPKMPERQVRLFAQFGNSPTRGKGTNVAKGNPVRQPGKNKARRTPMTEEQRQAIADKKRRMMEEQKKKGADGLGRAPGKSKPGMKDIQGSSAEEKKRKLIEAAKKKAAAKAAEAKKRKAENAEKAKKKQADDAKKKADKKEKDTVDN